MLGGIVVGVSMVSAIELLNREVVGQFRDSMENASGRAELQLVAPGTDSRLPDELAYDLGGVAGVEAALPVIDASVPMADSATRLRLFATDFTNPRAEETYGVTIVGGGDPLEILADPGAALLPEQTARRLSLAEGDTITVSGAIGRQQFRVAALLAGDGLLAATGEDFLVMDIMAAQRLLALDRLVDRIDIVPSEGASVAGIKALLSEAVGHRAEVVTPYGRGNYFANAVSSFQVMVFSLSLLALLTGMFIVYSAVSASVVSRQRAIGTLRAVGVLRREVMLMFAAEAVACGVVASTIGCLVGALLARVLSGQLSGAMGVIFQVRAEITASGLDAGVALKAIGLGTLCSLVAALLPAWKAASLHPLEALDDRPSGREALEGSQSRYFTLAAAVLVVLVVACIAAEVKFRSIMFGNIASTAWFLAFILASVPAVSWLALRLRPALVRTFGLAGRMASESLARSSRRSAVAVAALALSLATTITFAGLFLSFERSIVGYVGTFMDGDFSISSRHTRGGWLEEPIDSAILPRVEAVPGVDRVETLRLVSGYHYGAARVGLLALSDGFFTVDHYGPWFVEGRPSDALPAVRKGNAVLVSENFSRLHGVEFGQQLVMNTPEGELDLPVVGIVVDYTSDQGAIVLASRLYAAQWRDPTVNRLHVYTSSSREPAAMRAALVHAVRDREDLKLLSLSSLLEYHSSHVRRAFALAGSLELLMLIVTFAGIVDVLASSVNDRRREFALLSVVGADSRLLTRSVMAESAVLISAGICLGIFGGAMSAWMWVEFHWTWLLGWILELHFPWQSTARAALLATVVATLATWGPARAATRVDTMEALHSD